MTLLLQSFGCRDAPGRSAFPPSPHRRAACPRYAPPGGGASWEWRSGPAELLRAVASKGSVISASRGLRPRPADHGADKPAPDALVEGCAFGERRRDRRVVTGEGDPVD